VADLPGISCYCSTYGRPTALIENAIWCFLQQDYAGPKELVILNDFEQQELIFDHPEVRIVNHAQRIKPLGKKFNYNVSLCKYPLLAVWEDDDIFLKHRLSYSYARMRDGVFHSNDAFIEHAPGELGVMRNLFHSQHLFTKELFTRVGGYAEADRGSIDVTLMDALRKEVGEYSQDVPVDDLFYVYVWSGANSFHGSGMGADNEAVSDSAAEYVVRQVKEGRVQTGKVYLQPKPRYDVYEYLPTSKALFRPGNVRVAYGLPDGRSEDVTARIARLCTVSSGVWSVPSDDVSRAAILGDPAPNYVKQVRIQVVPGPGETASLPTVVPSGETVNFTFTQGQLSFSHPTVGTHPKIFINIASYRDDHELWATVKDAVRKAEHPERLRFAVVDQTAAPVSEATLAQVAPAQIEYLYVDYRFSRGPCWARALGYTLLYEEDYVLQVDSHSRFDNNWDTWFITTIKRLQGKSPKPYVGMMPYGFTYEGGVEKLDRSGGVTLNLLPNEGPITALANGYTGMICDHSEDIEGSHVSAGCVFAPADLFRQVLVDPGLYFNGEEHNFTVRAFTHGWDLFFVAGQPVFHLFNNSQQSVRSPHWNEEDDRQRKIRWWQYDQRSNERQKRLLVDPASLGAYGLGSARSLTDYATKFGVDYPNMVVHAGFGHKKQNEPEKEQHGSDNNRL
jgi:hypothetical protein